MPAVSERDVTERPPPHRPDPRPGVPEGLRSLDLEDVRARRDECLAEREYLSLLRRLCRAARRSCRRSSTRGAPARTRLRSSSGSPAILAGDEHPAPRAAKPFHVGVPEEEMLLARRRVERLVADAGISDPPSSTTTALAAAVDIARAPRSTRSPRPART